MTFAADEAKQSDDHLGGAEREATRTTRLKASRAHWLTAVGDRWPVRVAGWRPRHNLTLARPKRSAVKVDAFAVRVVFNFAVCLLVAAAYASTTLAFMGYNLAPPPYSKHDAWGVLLNFVTPVLGGAIAYSALRALSNRLGWELRGYRHHLARTFVWYGLVASALWVVFANRDNSDWGLFGQIVTWPMCSVATGLVLDLLLTVRLERIPLNRDAAG